MPNAARATRETSRFERHSPHDMTTEGRGRDARRVGDIPWSGWRDTLLRVRTRFLEDRLSIVAAGVAFYAVLATFPGLTALLTLSGVALDAGRIPGLLSSLQGRLSPNAVNMLTELLRSLADTENQQRLRVGVTGGLLLTMWGASLGIRALMQALNIAYAEEERRRFLSRIGLALLLTSGAIGVAIVLIVAVVGASAATAILDLDPLAHALLVYGRWPLVFVMFWASLLVMYRYGPSRRPARWSWVSWGAFIATVLWLIGSWALSWYVEGFGSYRISYGSVGLIVVLFVWYLLSAIAVLLGAEVNAELERQTRVDTTVGEDRPVGQRGAEVADTVGK